MGFALKSGWTTFWGSKGRLKKTTAQIQPPRVNTSIHTHYDQSTRTNQEYPASSVLLRNESDEYGMTPTDTPPHPKFHPGDLSQLEKEDKLFPGDRILS